VTFRFAAGSVSNGARLVIRCGADGNVWASIDELKTIDELKK
jgi:hypothetical protein